MSALFATAVLMAAMSQAGPAPLLDDAPPPTVHWTVKSAPGGPVVKGARFQVVLEAKIAPGWHLYALEEPEGGPAATEIALAEPAAADLLRVDQGKPRSLIDPLSHQLTLYF